MPNLVLTDLDMQISEEEVKSWLNVEFGPFKYRDKKRQFKDLSIEINPDTLRADLRACIKKDFRENPELRDITLSEMIVRANKGTLNVDSLLKQYLYWIKKLPEGEDLKVKIE